MFQNFYELNASELSFLACEHENVTNCVSHMNAGYTYSCGKDKTNWTRIQLYVATNFHCLFTMTVNGENGSSSNVSSGF